MLLFRSEEHVDRWCTRRQIPRGAVISLEQTWRLAQLWYADRLAPDWMPKSPDTIERIFADAGLTGDFWRVR